MGSPYIRAYTLVDGCPECGFSEFSLCLFSPTSGQYLQIEYEKIIMASPHTLITSHSTLYTCIICTHVSSAEETALLSNVGSTLSHTEQSLCSSYKQEEIYERFYVFWDVQRVVW
jgi:hypothetical protein